MIVIGIFMGGYDWRDRGYDWGDTTAGMVETLGLILTDVGVSEV